MIIEVRGTGVQNKGSELMLCAIRQHLADDNGGLRLAVEPGFGPYSARARYGLLTKLPGRRIGRSLIAQWTMSAAFRSTYGIVHEAEIDAVLDASGFAFGDQWGPGPSEGLAAQSTQWERRGVKAVLLPQAFGPFADERVRSAFRRALEHLPLVFARDRRSYEYIQGLGEPFSQVKQAPDFTNVVKGVLRQDAVLPDRFACIVPNIRMLDRTTRQEGAAYIGFLGTCVASLESRDITPLLLFHDPTNDSAVAGELNRTIGRELPVLVEEDPVHLKGVIQKAITVIGSRFHALAGALSQAIPAIATGWSHKYEMLFADYGCEQLVLSPSAPAGEVAERVEFVCSDHGQAGLRAHLDSKSAYFRDRADRMFADVRAVIGL